MMASVTVFLYYHSAISVKRQAFAEAERGEKERKKRENERRAGRRDTELRLGFAELSLSNSK